MFPSLPYQEFACILSLSSLNSGRSEQLFVMEMKIEIENTIKQFPTHAVISGVHACSVMSDLCLWDFPGKNTAVGCHFLLPGLFPTQGSEPEALVSPALAGRFSATEPPGKPCDLGSLDLLRKGWDGLGGNRLPRGGEERDSSPQDQQGTHRANAYDSRGEGHLYSPPRAQNLKSFLWGLTENCCNGNCQNQQVGCEQKEVRLKAEESAESHGAQGAQMVEHRECACPIYGSHGNPGLGWSSRTETGQVSSLLAAAESQASTRLSSPKQRGLTSPKDLPVHLIYCNDGETIFCNQLKVLRKTALSPPLSRSPGVSQNGALPFKGWVISHLQENGEINHSSLSPCDPLQTLKRTSVNGRGTLRACRLDLLQSTKTDPC